MFDRPQSGEKALLVYAKFSSHLSAEEIEEFRELAISAGAVPVATVTSARKIPDPRYLIGETKAEEIRQALQEHGAEVVLVEIDGVDDVCGS